MVLCTNMLVELIIGPQPKVVELGPSENQNRFKARFAEFIRAFADASHPLVIFLDDLQVRHCTLAMLTISSGLTFQLCFSWSLS